MNMDLDDPVDQLLSLAADLRSYGREIKHLTEEGLRDERVPGRGQLAAAAAALAGAVTAARRAAEAARQLWQDAPALQGGPGVGGRA